jgi:surface polysaccharide O-acyltransferase-like enzyme
MTPSSPFLSRRDGDLLRGTASLMVVMIHCISIWVNDFYKTHDFGSLGFFATFLDQLSRFTVPAVFFLSGFGLAQQYMARPESLKAYYRRRILKITAPFFLWSALTIYRPWGLLTALPWAEAPLDAVRGALHLLFLKGFDYQYYFLIVIVQFYLVFPFLFKLSRRLWFLIACLLLQLVLMSPIEGYLGLIGWSLPPLYSYLLTFYIFYCVAGSYAAWHPEWGARLVAALTRPQVWFLWAASLMLLVSEYWVNIRVLQKPLPYADHFNRWAVLVYCITTLILLLKHREWLRTRVHENPRWEFLYVVFMPYAFFVYLGHTHLLRLANMFLTGLDPLTFVTRIVFVAAGSYGVAWGAQVLLFKYPRLRFGLGLPKPPLTRGDFPGRALFVRRKSTATADATDSSRP